MAKRGHALLAALAFLALACLAVAEDVIDCSGFIRVSPEFTRLAPDVKINYAKDIKIVLKSAEGRVKFATEPEPNGFYIIPVYEKAEYTLSVQGPSGWSFAPNSVQVNLNSDSDVKCSADFLLKGFAIEGQIKGGERCGSAVTLGDLTLELTSKADTSAQAVTTQTRADGSYSITGVVPGAYSLKLNAATSSLTFEKTEINVEVSTSGIKTDGSFVLAGFEMSGRVQESASKKGVSGVTLQLSSDEVKSLPLCERPSSKSGVLCTAQTNDNGAFVFRGLPCASYRLVPTFGAEKGSAAFDISPAELAVKVDAGNLEISTPFQVSGFTIKGRVLDADGRGVTGVTVTCPQTGKSSTTDANGEYKFPGFSSGKYSFTASKSNLHFTSLSDVSITPQKPSLPQITVDGYSICGKLEIGGAKIASRTIALRGNGVDTTTKTDLSGQFCFDNIKSGKFTLAPETAESELARGLSINPRDVSVFTEPVVDVTFEAIRLKISGSVKCFDKCDATTTVSLFASGSDVTAVELDEKGDFLFENVIPGQYRLKVNADNRCFNNDELKVFLKNVDVADLKFEQIGYPIEVNVDRSVTVHVEAANLKGEGGNRIASTLNKGTNKICVDKKRDYVVTVAEDCFRFVDVAAGESDAQPKLSFAYQVGTSKPLMLRATTFKLSGTVSVADSKVDAKALTGEAQSNFEGKKALEFQKVSEKAFSYAYFGRVDEAVKFSFRYKDFVFYPREVLSEVASTAACPAPLAEVSARPPHYIEGSVNPATEAVVITVTSEDGSLATETPFLTDSKGKYRAGPFPDDKKYTVKAAKEGYIVKETSANTFEVFKLASVTVNIVSLEGEPVGSVFVSLSSADGYRRSELTNEKGSFKYLELAPSEYYVKPLMKEYEFQPSSQQVQIASGEDRTVTIKAKRIGYSVFGSVRSLNGDGEKQLLVEATPIGNDELPKEDGLTDNDGNYRIRGLKPGVAYSVQLRSDSEKNARVSRSEPAILEVKIPQKGADAKDVDFTVFRKISKFFVSGSVETDLDSLRTLSAQLVLRSETGDKIVAEEPLFPLSYFHFGSLEGHLNYAIRLKTNLTEKVFDYKIEPVELKPLNTIGSQSLRLKFTATRKFAGAEINENNMFGFWAAIFIALVVYFYQPISIYVNNFMDKSKKGETLEKKRVEDLTKNNDWVSGWAQKQKKNK